MGFGVMFVGLFFFWSAKINNFDVLPDFVGYIIILYGIKCATRYCNTFLTARKAAYAGVVVSSVVFLTQGLDIIGLKVIGDDIIQLIEAANQATRIVFLMILLLSVFSLAKETGAEKTQKRSLMSAVIVPVLWVGYIVIGVLNYFGVIKDEKILSAALFCEIIYVLAAAVGVFSAYMWICVEGDEDMPKKNKFKTPMDFYDRRREREAKENEELQRQKAAEAAGKSVSEMYGVKKKKKKGK